MATTEFANVQKIRKAYETVGLKAVVTFPAGCHPQIPIHHKYWFPIYTTCAELGIPVFAYARACPARVF